MTEFNEPLWVGMDVDAELARYAEEDRRRSRQRRKRASSSHGGATRGVGGLPSVLPMAGKEVPAAPTPLRA